MHKASIRRAKRNPLCGICRACFAGLSTNDRAVIHSGAVKWCSLSCGSSGERVGVGELPVRLHTDGLESRPGLRLAKDFNDYAVVQVAQAGGLRLLHQAAVNFGQGQRESRRFGSPQH